MNRHALYLALTCVVGLALLGSCVPPPAPPDMPGQVYNPNNPTTPVGTACAQVAVACLDQFARQPAKLICVRDQARWPRTSLTWRLVNPLPGLDLAGQTAAVQQAMDTWSAASGLTLQQTDGPADITLSFDLGDPFPFDGAGNNLAYAFFPGTVRAGQVHLCSQENWALTSEGGLIDVFTVALHEVGHALGVEHSTDGTAVMAPVYMTGVTGLASADVTAIQNLYGSPDGSVLPLPNRGEEFTGFCMDVGNLTALGDPDSDGDGVPDTIESFALDTDPTDGDSDDDGANDFGEVFTQRTNPLDPASGNGGTPPGMSSGVDTFSVTVSVDGVPADTLTLNDGITSIAVGHSNGDPTLEYLLIAQKAESISPPILTQVVLGFPNRSAVPGGSVNAAQINGFIQIGFPVEEVQLFAQAIPSIDLANYSTCGDCPSFDVASAPDSGTPSGTINLTLSGGRLFGSFDFTLTSVGGRSVGVVGTVDLPDEFGDPGNLGSLLGGGF